MAGSQQAANMVGNMNHWTLHIDCKSWEEIDWNISPNHEFLALPRKDRDVDIY